MTTHGMAGTPEYYSWKAMKTRCFNPNIKQYSNYGGRGITICDRWKNSFENFFADMGFRPTAKHSIDRIDNDGDYCFDNCKWSTKAEQANNRRNNKPLITIENETLTIADWAKKMGFSASVIYRRLELGWSEFDAVMTPVETDRLIAIGSKTYTISEWATEMGYGKTVIQSRLDRGWSDYDAVMTLVHTDKLITDGVKILTIAQWENEKGYGRSVIQNRLNKGWSESDAILTTVKNRKTKKNEGI